MTWSDAWYRAQRKRVYARLAVVIAIVLLGAALIGGFMVPALLFRSEFRSIFALFAGINALMVTMSPSSGSINPNRFVGLYHLTVPVGIYLPFRTWYGDFRLIYIGVGPTWAKGIFKNRG